MTANVLFSYQNDIKQRGIGDWLSSHISFMLPLHKYQGEVNLSDQQLVISHRGNGQPDIVLSKEEIDDLHYGFDDVFHRGQDRSSGLTFKPLRISYYQNGEKQVLYLITDFNRLRRSSKNSQWYNALLDWRN